MSHMAHPLQRLSFCRMEKLRHMGKMAPEFRSFLDEKTSQDSPKKHVFSIFCGKNPRKLAFFGGFSEKSRLRKEPGGIKMLFPSSSSSWKIVLVLKKIIAKNPSPGKNYGYYLRCSMSECSINDLPLRK